MAKCKIGGQAVIEGVMMRNGADYAIAIRKPDDEIIIENRHYVSFSKRVKVLGLPFLRGVVALLESMVLGMKILTFSAEFYEVEEEQSKFEKKLENKYGAKKMNDILIGISVVVAILMSVGLFVLLPLFVSQLLDKVFDNKFNVNLIDGLLRVVILLIYMSVITLMEDIKRVFQYHGAEHKTINCYEHDEDLTVENVKKHSRYHKRCGTSFIFVVVLISIGILTIIGFETFWLRLGVRLLMFPVIAGISYEVIQLLGKKDTKLSLILSKPGMWLQKLTTKEPDDKMIEVAIASVEAVLPKDEV